MCSRSSLIIFITKSLVLWQLYSSQQRTHHEFRYSTTNQPRLWTQYTTQPASHFQDPQCYMFDGRCWCWNPQTRVVLWLSLLPGCVSRYKLIHVFCFGKGHAQNLFQFSILCIMDRRSISWPCRVHSLLDSFIRACRCLNVLYATKTRNCYRINHLYIYSLHCTVAFCNALVLT